MVLLLKIDHSAIYINYNLERMSINVLLQLVCAALQQQLSHVQQTLTASYRKLSLSIITVKLQVKLKDSLFYCI